MYVCVNIYISDTLGLVFALQSGLKIQASHLLIGVLSNYTFPFCHLLILSCRGEVDRVEDLH